MTHSIRKSIANASQNISNEIKQIDDRLKPDWNVEGVSVVIFDDNSIGCTERPVEGSAECIGIRGGMHILPVR